VVKLNGQHLDLVSYSFGLIALGNPCYLLMMSISWSTF